MDIEDSIDVPVDEQHAHEDLKITAEEYSEIQLKPVKIPKTPDININETMNLIHLGQILPEVKEELTANGGEYNKEIKKKVLYHLFGQLSVDEMKYLVYKWSFWARHNQLAPAGDWIFWLLLAGRGFGKTRTGAEWINDRVQSGQAKRIALVAPTAADVRKVMVEGESGILAISPPWNRPLFEPSKLQLTWPNGAIAGLFSAEEPERLRGPQCDTFWADETAAWKKLVETWDMLQFGFRLGDKPQGCITTTPKPLPLLKELLAQEKSGEVVATRGSTYENRGNLTPKFFTQVVKKYEGTRLGKQELDAEILEDMPGALWKRSDIDKVRIKNPGLPMPAILKAEDPVPGSNVEIQDMGMLKRIAYTIMKLVPEDLTRIVVAVDPNASNDEGSDEIGIVVAGQGVSGQGYVLADLSMKGSPNDWASTAIIGHDVFSADRIIGEANQGGNMVSYTVEATAKFLRMEDHRRSDFVSIVLVHATRGKVTRAEPAAALYEQGRVSHVGTLSTLEDQMCLFTTDFDRKSMGYSPDRVDALVWALTHLFLEDNDTGILDFYKQEHVAKLAREANSVSGANTEPTSDWVRMSAPAGVSTIHGGDGTQYNVVDGVATVKPDDVKGLRAAGFVKLA